MTTLVDIDKLVLDPPELGYILHLSGLPGASSKIYDRSPYGNHGSITGATWIRTPGGLWCLSFDGSDDYVDFGDALQSEPLETIQIWLYSSSEINSSTSMPFIELGVDGANNQRIYLGSYTGTIANEVIVCLRGAGHNYHYTTTAIPAGWNLLSFVWNGSSQDIYVNTAAQTVSTYQPCTTPWKWGDSLVIGKMGASYFTGRVALFRLYNRALSTLEIQNHFNREKHLFGV